MSAAFYGFMEFAAALVALWALYLGEPATGAYSIGVACWCHLLKLEARNK